MAGITWPKQSQPSKARMQDVCGREGGMATTAFLFVRISRREEDKQKSRATPETCDGGLFLDHM